MLRRTRRELAAENAVLLNKLEELREDLQDFLVDADDIGEDDVGTEVVVDEGEDDVDPMDFDDPDDEELPEYDGADE